MMDAWIYEVAQKCKHLTHLVLPICQITDEGLEALAAFSPQLQYLYLGGFGLYTQQGIDNLQATLPNLVIQTHGVPNFDGIQSDTEDSSEESSGELMMINRLNELGL